MILVFLDLINCSSDDCPGRAEDDPDGRRDEHEANKVDVVVHSIEHGRQEILE